MQEAPITTILLVVTSLVSVLTFNNSELRNKLMFSPYQMERDKSYYRFITCGFIHADFQHLIFNMLSLFMIGRHIEAFFNNAFDSSVPYIVMYLAGIAAASLPDFFQHRNNPSYAALGASGAVSAVVISLVFFEPWNIRLGFFFIPPIIPSIVFGVLYLAFSSYMAKQNRDNIGHSAHFWGGIWGFFYTMLVAMFVRPDLVSLFAEKLTHPGNFGF